MRSAPARPVRACFVRSCCSVAVQEHDLRASPVQCNVKQALSSHITLHPSHFTVHTSKDNSITRAAAARSNLDAAITMRSAKTELQNTIDPRATAPETGAPKPNLDATAEKRRF